MWEMTDSVKSRPRLGGRTPRCQQGCRVSPAHAVAISNSVVSLCISFPQAPRRPQPTAQQRSPPRPLLGEHMMSWKTNSDAKVRGGSWQKCLICSQVLVNFLNQEGRLVFQITTNTGRPRNPSAMSVLGGSPASYQLVLIFVSTSWI